MQTLPTEIIEQIILYLPKITDKRHLTQTCKLCNVILYPIIKNQQNTIKIEHFKYTIEICAEKFTLELCNDSYFNLIPISYLTPENNVIVKALTIYGQIELLKQALCNNCKLFMEVRQQNDYSTESMEKYNNNSCAHAIISGSIKMLKFVRLHGCRWDNETFELAIKYNNFDTVKFLKEYGCEMPGYISEYVAINGNIIMLEWLIENGLKIHKKLCDTAAKCGHFEFLKLLRHKYNCPWNQYTTSGAAEYGYLDILKWCIDNGCEFNSSHAYSNAWGNKQLHICSWMWNNGY